RFVGFLAWGVPAPASRVIVVADAHLGQVPPATVAAFHRFLDAVPDLGDALLINGDLFDFWFEYRSVIPRRHFGTMAKLQSVRARDVELRHRAEMTSRNHRPDGEAPECPSARRGGHAGGRQPRS